MKPSIQTIRGILFVSFALNVAALYLPFVDVSVALSGTDSYTLLRSVTLLWDVKLYVLSVVVVAFSIVFPFAKLAILFWISGHPTPDSRDRRWLARVEALGKWSMIDVFIVCFILALTNDQFFVGATPRPGIHVFLGAIVLSVLSGELLARRWQIPAEPRGARVPTWVGFGMLLFATFAWLGLLTVPFLQIEDWLLKKTAFTMITFLAALFSQGAPIAALVLAGGLIVAPAFELVSTWTAWNAARRDRDPPRWVRIRDTVRHWSMLNVFLVALLIFLAEGDALMTVAPRNGLIFLSVLLLIDVSLFFVSRRGGEEEPLDGAAVC